MIRLVINTNDDIKKDIGLAVAIGNFDGMHLGHLQLINQLKFIAKKKDYTSAIVMFYPLTHEYLHGYNHKKRISLIRDNINFLKTKNLVDQVILIHFNSYISNQSQKEFTEKILIEKLNVKHVVVGYDFSYGYKSSGNINSLKQLNITTSEVSPYQIDNNIISSSLIRSLILKGDFETAVKYLGHPLTFTGRVTYGKQLSRTANIPTANIKLNKINLILQGVFSSYLYVNNTKYCAITNIGKRPTLNSDQNDHIETHILNCDNKINLYGKVITVEPVKYIRSEKKFDNQSQVFLQIQQDIMIANNHFKLYC